jgi:predicted RNA binding protein YcfA (HicA-like mRNA interferase family)
MAKRDFSGDDVIKVLVNRGGFWVDRVNGDHYILKYEHPSGNDDRTVVVPRHSSLRIGTLRDIADDAGANNFNKFCEWIDRNR